MSQLCILLSNGMLLGNTPNASYDSTESRPDDYHLQRSVIINGKVSELERYFVGTSCGTIDSMNNVHAVREPIRWRSGVCSASVRQVLAFFDSRNRIDVADDMVDPRRHASGGR